MWGSTGLAYSQIIYRYPVSMLESIHFIYLVYSCLCCCFSAENVLCFVVKLVAVLLQEGLQVIGKCGGRCGTCSPKEDVGLQVQLVQGNLSH